MENIRQNQAMDDREKNQMLQAKNMKSIANVLQEVEAVIDIHFFDEFLKTKASTFLKKAMENQGTIDLTLF